jgi:hypothetical protein
MPLNREQALATLRLSATPDADVVQSAFERLARRYPQPSFPERFRQLLEARDQLLDAGRTWRELVESSTLDLTWILPHLQANTTTTLPDRRKSLQDMLRAGYLAESLQPPADDDSAEDDDGGIPF